MPDGAIVTLAIDDANDLPQEKLEHIAAEIQAKWEQDAQRLRRAFEQESWQLKGEVLALERQVNQILSRPTLYINQRDFHMSEYKTEIKGNFQGALGEGAHAHHLNY